MTHPLDLPRVVIDFETRSELNLRDVGAWRYSEHPSTEVICMSYRMPDGRRTLWTPSLPFPRELTNVIESDEHAFEAHGAQFEQAIWHNVLNRRAGVPVPRHWVDTMASCAYRSVPMGLDEVGMVLGLSTQKDKRGKYLIQQLCKPRRPLKAERTEFENLGLSPDRWPTLWREDWGLFEEMYDYCDRDVDTEYELGEILGDLTRSEYELWVLDQEINRRGVCVDVGAVEAALGIVELMSGEMTSELVSITGGAVTTGNQVSRIVEWLRTRGVTMSDLRAETVNETIGWLRADVECGRDDAVDPLRVLEIRKTLGSSSVKKLYKFRDCLCDDDRIRGLLQYHGAGTGRWSGRLLQPQNFPRGDLESFARRLSTDLSTAMELLIETVKLGGQDAVDMLGDLFGDVTNALTTALRGMFVAAPGKVFHVADFSAIEAVVVAWVAGEEWKLDAFRAIQRGEKYEGADDIYCATASSILGRPVSKREDPKDRQMYGKVPELAFGYQGGVGAWRNFDSSGALDDAAVDHIKNQWRERHPAIVRLWHGLENAAVDCLRLNRRVSYRSISFEPVLDAAGSWLTIILPNKRRLWYFNPQLDDVRTPWGEMRQQVSYEGRDNKRGGQWGVVSTYGGMICLAANTEVLTNRGWLYIVNVQLSDLLWDGVEWIPHDGLVYQGESYTIDLDGVRITPDHEVLTYDGWIAAADCDVLRAYAVGEALGEPDIRKVDCVEILRSERLARGSLDVRVRLRNRETSRSQRFSERRPDLMRLRPHREEKSSRSQPRYTSNEFSPGLSRMAVYVKSLSAIVTSGLEELWWSWYTCMRKMEIIRELLVRHGTHLQTRFTDRENKQRRLVFAGELLLGNTRRPSSKQTHKRVARHPERQDDLVRGSHGVQHKEDHVVVANKERLECRESVYDLVNAGPRHRFMVRGDEGVMIVHNCENVVQAISRDIMAESMLLVERHGYSIVLTIHDEIISEDDEDHGSQEEFERLVSVVPDWLPGCPVGVSGWTGRRYRKE